MCGEVEVGERGVVTPGARCLHAVWASTTRALFASVPRHTLSDTHSSSQRTGWPPRRPCWWARDWGRSRRAARAARHAAGALHTSASRRVCVQSVAGQGTAGQGRRQEHRQAMPLMRFFFSAWSETRPSEKRGTTLLSSRPARPRAIQNTHTPARLCDPCGLPPLHSLWTPPPPPLPRPLRRAPRCCWRGRRPPSRPR